LGAFTKFSKINATGLKRPERIPVMRIARRIRSASLHAFWALLSVVRFWSRHSRQCVFRDTPAKEDLTLLASCYIHTI
jgi:hypothetical protein